MLVWAYFYKPPTYYSLMGFIRGVGILWLSISIILLIIIGTAGLIFNSFLYHDVYLQTFDKAGIYELIEKNLNNTAGATFIKIPEEGPKVLVADFLGNLLAYLRSDSDKLNLTVQIDLKELREFFLKGVKNATICSVGEKHIEGREIRCKPADMSDEQFLEEIFNATNYTFPETDQVDLTSVYGLEEGSEDKVRLDKFREYIHIFKIGLWVIGLIILIFIFLIYLLAKERKNFFRITGFTLLITGVLLFLSSILSYGVFIGILEGKPDLMVSVVNPLIDIVLGKIEIYGIIVGVIGMILVISSFFLPKKK